MAKKKIGLALGGGAVLGAAHIGVIQAIEESEIEIAHITGTSIGAFIASLYAFGKNCEELKEIGSKLKWFDIAGIKLSGYALLSNQKLGDLITQSIGDKNIKEASIPLAMVATNVVNGEKVVLSEGKVAQAVMASCAIPGIFEPVDLNNQTLVDGGVVENVPVSTLNTMSKVFNIGVDLNSSHTYEKPKNILEVILNSFHFLMMNSSKFQTKEANLIIAPDLSKFSRSDINQVEELIEAGYQAAKEALKEMN